MGISREISFTSTYRVFRLTWVRLTEVSLYTDKRVSEILLRDIGVVLVMIIVFTYIGFMIVLVNEPSLTLFHSFLFFSLRYLLSFILLFPPLNESYLMYWRPTTLPVLSIDYFDCMQPFFFIRMGETHSVLNSEFT